MTLGAYGKGRSSSFHLNGILRSALGWSLLSRKQLFNVWISTSVNASDHPSRQRPIPPRQLSTMSAAVRQLFQHWHLDLSDDCAVPSPIQPRPGLPREAPASGVGARLRPPGAAEREAKVLPPPPGLARPCQRVRARRPEVNRVGQRQGFCVEAYSGSGHLTSAWRKCRKLRVGAPIEAYQPGGYVAACDLDLLSVQRELLQRIRSREVIYVHFGIPCSSWSSLQRMNGGSRRKHLPQGSGLLSKEIRGNDQADFVVRACRLLLSMGGYFSIENPAYSYLWDYQPMQDLLSDPSCFDVFFHQCMWGLQPPAPKKNEFLKKATKLRTNLSTLTSLARVCDGNHEHCWVLGSRVEHGVRISVAKAAGAYPADLCAAWARATERCLLAR